MTDAKTLRCAIVGAGHRAHAWIDEMISKYGGRCELVGVCDPVLQRAHDMNTTYGTAAQVFDHYGQMLEMAKPDLVIVVSPDHVHATQICQALAAGCEVATEKPLCTTADDARKILEAEQASGKQVTMGFNYRHIPLASRVKQLIIEGAIGRPVSMDLTWYLDYHGHGISYFRRWHRMIKLSGGLLITKGSHHIDLANWWMGDVPQTVFARCEQNFFGPHGKNPYQGVRCRECQHADKCRFFSPVNVAEPDLDQLSAELGYRVKKVRDYPRDYCPFGDEVDAYDTMALLVQYRNGGVLNYTLNAAAPFEGWNVAINGTEGRLEAAIPDSKPARGWQKQFKIVKKGLKVINPADFYVSEWPENYSIFVMPFNGQAYEVEVPNIADGHGGGDQTLFRMVFTGDRPRHDPLSAFATVRDGALSVAVGDAANRSARSGAAIRIDELLAGQA
jgi:predicted dehydrogenase